MKEKLSQTHKFSSSRFISFDLVYLKELWMQKNVGARDGFKCFFRWGILGISCVSPSKDSQDSEILGSFKTEIDIPNEMGMS